MLVGFQGDMILKYNMGHQYTPFLIEAGCSNLASVSVMKVPLSFSWPCFDFQKDRGCS